MRNGYNRKAAFVNTTFWYVVSQVVHVVCEVVCACTSASLLSAQTAAPQDFSSQRCSSLEHDTFAV